METKLNSFLNENTEPFRNHKIRIKNGYKPKYRPGIIGIRFLDDEYVKHEKNFESGIPVNYHDLFSMKKYYMNPNDEKYINYFEKKYDIKQSNYREGSDDYYVYFSCTPGTEKEKLELLSKDPIVIGLDYVDTREIELDEELKKIGEELDDLSYEVSEMSKTKLNKILDKYIKKLEYLRTV